MRKKTILGRVDETGREETPREGCPLSNWRREGRLNARAGGGMAVGRSANANSVAVQANSGKTVKGRESVVDVRGLNCTGLGLCRTNN